MGITILRTLVMWNFLRGSKYITSIYLDLESRWKCLRWHSVIIVIGLPSPFIFQKFKNTRWVCCYQVLYFAIREERRGQRRRRKSHSRKCRRCCIRYRSRNKLKHFIFLVPFGVNPHKSSYCICRDIVAYNWYEFNQVYNCSWSFISCYCK